jgi:SNF2 family DNA or RNA helicase
MEAAVKDNTLYVKTRYGEGLANQLNSKGLGMRFNRKTNLWEHPLTFSLAEAFSKTFPDHTPQRLHEFLKVNVSPSWFPSEYLMEHQRQAAELALTQNRHGFFHQTGTGKTLSGLEIWKQKRVKTLVVCPLSIINNAWIEDAQKFVPEVKIINLWDYKRKRKSQSGSVAYRKALDGCDIAVINFDSFRTIADELMDEYFEMLMVDESSKAKEFKSKTTKALIKFADHVRYVYLFSGTPAPNSELEYFSQIRMLDRTLFSPSFYGFRAQYFYPSGFGGYTWKMMPGRRQEFLDKLSKVTSVVRKEDVLDLPDKTTNVRDVFLTKKETKAYNDMKNHLIVELDGTEVLAANAAVKLMKLREATSGFFLDEEKHPVVTGDSKLKELAELIDEIHSQVIVWTNFHYEANAICQMLDRKGVSWVRADGTVDQAGKDHAIHAFRAGEAEVFIAHPASVGHGITLTNCSFMIYFSFSYSYELHQQSMDRIYRYGQHNACSYYYLVAKDTVDEVIVQALGKKKKVVDEVFAYIKEFKR